MTNIIICGLPGAGKTTVGQLLAENLKMRFIDTDALIEKYCGLPCREYYLQKGERAFRKVESTMINSLEHEKQCVIALGGGAFETSSLIDFIRKLGVVIFLDAPIEVLIERKVHNDTAAYAMSGADYQTMSEKRLPAFRYIANVHIDTAEKSPKLIAMEVSDIIIRIQDGK